MTRARAVGAGLALILTATAFAAGYNAAPSSHTRLVVTIAHRPADVRVEKGPPALTAATAAAPTVTAAAPPATSPPAPSAPLASAPTSSPSPTAPPPSSAPSSSAPGGFLACVRHHESRGIYTVTDGADPGAELNMGAYQFSQSTWDNTARHAGRPDLVGIPPNEAAPADQDRMAAELYAWQGAAPWAGSGC